MRIRPPSTERGTDLQIQVACLKTPEDGEHEKMIREEVHDQTPPFVWPDPRSLSGHWSDRGPVLEPLAYAAEILYGIVAGVDAQGVQWLESLLESRKELKCRMLLALYPACPTRRHELARLLELQRFFEDRIQFRMLVAGIEHSLPGNALCCVMSEAQSFLITGAAPNFGLSASWVGEVGATVCCDATLLASWSHWFDYAWESGAPLGASTIDIPYLVPAQGDPAASAAWRAYMSCCARMVATAQGTSEGQVEVDPKTGAIAITSTHGQSVQTASQALGVPGGDDLAERIARLYQAGDMVTIDKHSRVRPLDAPMQPEWFGVSSFRQVGRISSETRFRISVIDDGELRDLESKRKMVGRLLEVLSYPLGDGVRWMPHRAKSLFQEEMDRVNTEGLRRLNELVNGDPDAYVDSQRPKIVEDANEMYKEFHGADRHGTVTDYVIADIVRELKGRVSEAMSGKHLLPTVTFSSVGFRPGGAADGWSSPWGQALTLVSAIAEFPRELLTNIYFLRGVNFDEEKLMDAMDVWGDHLVAEWKGRGSYHGVRGRAKAELALLKDFRRTSAESRTRCEAIALLLEGDEGVAIRSAMKVAEKAEHDQRAQAQPAQGNPTESR